MVTSSAGNWTVRGVTLALWALAAASVAYWGMKLASSPATSTAAAPGLRSAPAVDSAAVARLLGATPGAAAPGAAPAAPSLASRFVLTGVVADRSQHGTALIAVDGRPPKPYRVGSELDDGLVLRSVQSRQAVIAASADGPPLVTLELPPLAR